MKIILNFGPDPSLASIRVGLVQADGIRWPDSIDPRFSAKAVEFGAAGEAAIAPSRKAAVRDMLRHGSYKPAGRAKPSSEYLLAAALEGDFPSVNCFVDAANLVSLVSGYPISIVDLDKSGPEFLIRRGLEGEAYVFNSGGQTIDLKDLLCACRKEDGAFVPTANPVRDSMATKIFPGALNLAAFIYAPAGPEGRELEKACAELSAYLGEVSASVDWSTAAPADVGI
jgi:DNA/RNA-binding domain of Phe-tRNA-synthetase-like protein